MSLKHFHIAFITIVVLGSWSFGAWCLLTRGLPSMFTAMGWASVVGGFGLLVYGVRFMKKIRKVVS
ncbi:hypothetical protein VSU19_06585 [Verrucomicrobiales bacterium BCK34]|nr:hypothetical protein [Verrucomicrobiales bacterium BCK34]